MGDTVLYERDERIGYITLNRPQVLNAINDAWIRDLLTAATAARDDLEARVIVVRGAGRAFCAGADLKETPQRRELMEYRARHMDPEQEIGRLLRRTGKPVIAQVHGYAVGGGCELAMLADLRIAAEGTRFGFTEVRVGATVTMGGLYNLTRLVGLGRAFELLYTAELIDAAEALRIGLVNRVVATERLAEAVRALATRIAGHFPLEVALTRNSLYRALDLDFDAAVEDETGAALLSYLGGAREQGMAQAMEKLRQERPGA
ncbi:MAG: enoyl-CoA hydratase/isomerase family protein [candidate division NC10 bacterium]|nr:enoyl-CoA hydratase/isomerase family protein [Candidatus Rokubacteria bacterium]MBI2560851.1 enoyl-CoA hydratase/isomerase family protein [candidate division NC10 bacterium]